MKKVFYNPVFRNLTLLSLVVVLFFTTIAARYSNYNKITFHTGDIASAQKLAKEQRKLYFVDFVASWCTPCKFMEETTYKNAVLANYINDNYIPVKVDIDDFDGFVYKKKYNIKVLPTIMIFNEKGEVVGRKEESMSATDMMAFLKSKRGISRPPLPRVSEAPKVLVTNTVVKPIKVVTPATNPVVKSSFRYYDPKADSKYFGVQISVVSKLESVDNEVKRIKRLKVNEQVIIYKKWKEGIPLYHVLVGKFADKQKAEAYKATLKSKDIVAGMVKMYSQI
ncbi:MAG: thioredoxin family protein [Saprospiraceae bacterium]|nr:thioredoxin family protein [Saprospiraceae bacterium]